MPKIYVNKSAGLIWNRIPRNERARSLAACRMVPLAESQKDTEWRRDACEAIKAGAALGRKSQQHAEFLAALNSIGAKEFIMKLQARLILNAAGGVLENGGISLDRNSGVPYIPGSAVKGCARRAALHDLANAEDIREKASILRTIFDVFGCSDQDWKPGRRNGVVISDFWLAMLPLGLHGPDEDHERDRIWTKVLGEPPFGNDPNNAQARLIDTNQRPLISGGVAFMPAYPVGGAQIEIDVLTPHHPLYYSGHSTKPVATDDEDPRPTLFPTIAAGTEFRFAVVPLRGKHLVRKAVEWLETGLTAFGIGAKTNAGYGWFARPGAPQVSQGTGAANASAPADRFIQAWSGKLSSNSNFKMALKDLAAIEDPAELERAFTTVVPQIERNRIRKNQPYWQSFSSNPDGKKVLERLSIKLS